MSSPPDNAAPQPEELRRRRFLSRLLCGISGLFGAAIAVGPLGVALHPLFSRRADPKKEGWTRVGGVDRFRVGDPPVRVVLKADLTDAWRTRRDQPLGAVMVERLDAANFRVFSARCPHLGCSVHFQADRQEFVCPCHRSAFDVGGARVEKAGGEANPAPRGLDALAWQVANGALEVKWVRYQTGTADQIPVG